MLSPDGHVDLAMMTDADLARDAGIGIGHVGGRALVTRQDMGHAVVETVERIVKRQAGIAAQAEDVLHAVVLQHAHEGFGAGKLVGGH